LGKLTVWRDALYGREDLLRVKKRCFGLDAFIEQAHKAHLSVNYDYSRIPENVKIRDKVLIGCPECGVVFEQRLVNHIHAKTGCPNCMRKKANAKRCKTRQDFIQEAFKIHGDKYDYSLIPENPQIRQNVPIVCKIHNETFYQNVGLHLRGVGCPKCGRESSFQKKAKVLSEFIREAKNVHGEKYDYSLIPDDYRMYQKVPIICIRHNKVFHQTASLHIRGSGCPECGRLLSKSEKELYSFISGLGYELIQNYRKWSSRHMEIDLFIPSLQIGFEYNGVISHHSDPSRSRCKALDYHKNKTELALSNGIKLYHFFDWMKLDDIKSIIQQLLLTGEVNFGEKIINNGLRNNGVSQRDLFPRKEDTSFYRNGWQFIRWEPLILYWNPKNRYNIQEENSTGSWPISTSGRWVFEEPGSRLFKV
jgi:predicted  nucleic acid-binding Zn-ribbon protein